MALPKNKSRRISVDDIDYRYAISISWKDDGNFDFNVTVQNESSNGSKLLLKGLVTRDFWLDFSDKVGEQIDSDLYPTITPRHIAYFIRQAIIDGWNSEKRVKDFILEVSNKDLTR
ncbi:hypothetical protein [Pleionea sediminis]|uniref:hypothetical protein n=1 Tax=Pleionea sediminis TaxID=2569479 RepID=UPI001184DAE8|nr:hypothetical protein [Pleionea sediminis]